MQKRSCDLPSTDGVVVPVALAKIVSSAGMNSTAQQHFHSHVLFAEEYRIKLIETIGQFV